MYFCAFLQQIFIPKPHPHIRSIPVKMATFRHPHKKKPPRYRPKAAPFTSQDDAEIKWCIEMLMKTDAGTGFMHESFHVDDPMKFTREWFAWQNGLFGELILKIIADGKLELLNSINI